MKLQSGILISKSVYEGQCLQQLINGFQYFEKYYLNLSRTSSGIDYQCYANLWDFCRITQVGYLSENLSYSMQYMFVIVKDLEYLAKIYNDALGLQPTLYFEWLKMMRLKFSRLIETTFEEIYRDETGTPIGLSKTCRTQIDIQTIYKK